MTAGSDGDLGRGAVGDHPAEVQHGDALGERGDQADVVLDQEDRGARRGAARRSARRGPAAPGRAGRRRARPAAAPRLARRARGRPGAGAAGRAGARRPGARPSRGAPPARGTPRRWARISRSSRRCDGGRSAAATTPARVRACAPTITFASRLMPGKIRAPWNTIADAPAGPRVRGQPVDPPAGQADRPAVGPDVAGDQVEERRLAGAVGPDDARAAPPRPPRG